MKVINHIVNKYIDKISYKLYQNMHPIISEALAKNHISSDGEAPRSTCVYIGNDRCLTKNIFDQKMIIPARDLSLAPHLILDGYWERWITKVFMQKIKPGMTVLDIGANCGYYTLLACKQLNGTGKVYAFEANPFLCEIISESLFINGYNAICEVMNIAAYKDSTELQFDIHNITMGGSKIHNRENILKKDMGGADYDITTISVQANSIDNIFCADSKIDFIKMDAEGAEFDIISGMKRILQENKHVQLIVEYNPGHLHGSGKNSDDFFYMFSNIGFKIYKINHESLLQPITAEDLKHLKTEDVYMTREN